MFLFLPSFYFFRFTPQSIISLKYTWDQELFAICDDYIFPVSFVSVCISGSTSRHFPCKKISNNLSELLQHFVFFFVNLHLQFILSTEFSSACTNRVCCVIVRAVIIRLDWANSFWTDYPLSQWQLQCRVRVIISSAMWQVFTIPSLLGLAETFLFLMIMYVLKTSCILVN